MYYLLQYPKNRKVGPNWRARGDALRFEGGDPLENFFEKTQCRKKLKGDPLVLPAEKGNTFLVQFPVPTDTIWRLLKIL